MRKNRYIFILKTISPLARELATKWYVLKSDLGTTSIIDIHIILGTTTII
jgi:hypothetical protein